MNFDDIPLPNRQYEWYIDHQERGSIGDDGIFISEDKEGYVSVHVKDTFIANNTGEGSLKIVFPFGIDLEIVDIT